MIMDHHREAIMIHHDPSWGIIIHNDPSSGIRIHQYPTGRVMMHPHLGALHAPPEHSSICIYLSLCIFVRVHLYIYIYMYMYLVLYIPLQGVTYLAHCQIAMGPCRIAEEPMYIPEKHNDFVGSGIALKSALCMPVFSKVHSGMNKSL